MYSSLTPLANIAAGAQLPISLLAVDDSSFDRARLRRMCQKTGLRIKWREAQTPEEMFDKLLKHRIDIVILDYVLPQIDGLTCAGRLRADAVTNDLGILLVSGVAQTKLRARAIMAGCDGCLEKSGLTTNLLRDRILHTQFIQAMRSTFASIHGAKPGRLN